MHIAYESLMAGRHKRIEVVEMRLCDRQGCKSSPVQVPIYRASKLKKGAES